MSNTLTTGSRAVLVGPMIWLTPLCMLMYSLLRFGVGGRSGPVLLVVAAEAAAYLLTVFLFYGVACLFARHAILFTGGLTLLILALSIWLTGGQRAREIMCSWGAISVGGCSIGRLADSKLNGRDWYLAGLAIVVGFGLVWLVPQWPQLHDTALAARGHLLDGLQPGAPGGVPGSGLIAGYSGTIEKWSSVVIRLLPLIMIMNIVLQYTVGFLWFAQIHSTTPQGRLSPLKSFPYWRMPFWTIPVTVAAVVTRLVGNETVQLASDNLLAALSIFYCVIGLSILEYHLRRFKAHWGLKSIVYVLLLPTGIIAMAGLAGMGAINNLYDWRKQSRVE